MKIFEKEVVVIGAGPAGLSAAIEAKKAGAQVLVIDENSRPGGQLFKQIHKFFGSADHFAGQRGFEIADTLCKQAKDLGVELWLDTVAYGIFDEGIGIVKDGTNYLVKAQKTVIAAGGTENPIAFPGSTLPGIMTAGAAQTLANVYRTLPGKRVVVLGSGNVGLIVAYQLMQGGAEIAAVVEKAAEIGGYAVHAEKVTRAGVPIYTNTVVKRAEGKDQLESVVLVSVNADGSEIPGTEQTVSADTLCIAVGMSPLTELVWQAGAEFEYIGDLGGFVPLHDACMETTVPGIYVAGDVTGIEEACIAMEEGRLAGISVAEATGHLSADAAQTMRCQTAERIALLESGENGGSRKAARQQKLQDMQNKR